VEGGREDEGFRNEKPGVEDAGGEVLGWNNKEDAGAVTVGDSVV
jgi:hypothetical protein